MLRRIMAAGLACAVALACTPRHAAATPLAVDLWLDQGDAAVYQPGQSLGIRAHVSGDAFLLVYEIDSQGYVNLLYPIAGRSGFVEAGNDLEIPPEGSQLDLVAEEPTGEGYVVALVSREPFKDLPWYLRPFDTQAQGVGYQGDTPPEEQGVTSDGKIVGDPFVAMERIRRRVLQHPDDNEAFATSYTTFYVHERVKYPRYLCDDCHHPSQWTWWPDYDPYYATCTAFTFRVNWGWYWGPAYWAGYVPYYVYVPAPGCPPWVNTGPGITYSSWLGWGKQNALWGGRMTRHLAAPPAGYVGPATYARQGGRIASPQGRMQRPPGFVTADANGSMLRGGRGMVYGRFNGSGRDGGMMTTREAGAMRPMTPQRGGGNGATPGVASTRGAERPMGRGFGRQNGGSGTPQGGVEAPQRLRFPERSATPQRFESPGRSQSPGRYESPQRVGPPQRLQMPQRTASPGVGRGAPSTRPAPAARAGGGARPAAPGGVARSGGGGARR